MPEIRTRRKDKKKRESKSTIIHICYSDDLPSNTSNAPAQPPRSPTPCATHRQSRHQSSQVKVGGSQLPSAVVLKCRLWFTPQPQRPQYCEQAVGLRSKRETSGRK